VAILLDYKLKPEISNRIEILASDINLQVIEKARQGLYRPYALQKIQKYFRARYFKQLSNDQFTLSESIKKRVQFFRHNLLDHNPFGRFDIIICRNVMIYFDLNSKNRVLHQLNRSLKPQGYLITGYAESLFRTETNLKYIQPTLYMKD
jgi:chemotaxis protein methyltransferase CheR